MARKAPDEQCRENYIAMKNLFQEVVPDATRFQVVYGSGLDVGLSDFIVVRVHSYSYSSYMIGFDANQVEIVIVPIDAELESYGEPIYLKKDDVKGAKISFVSKEITIKDKRLPKKYIQFSVPEYINQDPDDLVMLVKQDDEYAEFMDFFKNKFKK